MHGSQGPDHYIIGIRRIGEVVAVVDGPGLDK